MSLFEPDVKDFMVSFNEIIAAEYGFQWSNDFIGNGGKDGDPANDDSNENPKQSKKEKKHIQFGDVMNPCFGITGEFLGFQMRPEMAHSVMLDSEFDVIHLKRLMKLCIHINKMFKFGRNDDFEVKQIKNGLVVQTDTKKTFTVAEVQVDPDDLIQLANQFVTEKSQASEGEEELPADPNLKVLTLLKNHTIDIVTRLKPKGRTYYKMVWENKELPDLLDTKLDRVYKDAAKEK